MKVLDLAKKAFTKIKEVVKSNKRIEAQGGQAIVGCLLEKADVENIANTMSVAEDHPQNVYSDGTVLKSCIASMCSGNCTYEALNEFNNDSEFYEVALDIEHFPSISRFRQRIDQIGECVSTAEYKPAFWNMNKNLLEGEPFTCIESGRFIPIDIDVTPFDESKSHKEGVSKTYKKCDGYAPINAYMGREGFLINTELRIGKQHCQKNTPDFLRETINIAKDLAPNKPLLIRLDSGNDAAENMGLMLEEGVFFIIKRNLRQEASNEGKHYWLSFAKGHSVDITNPREGKTVYRGTTWKDITYKDKNEKTQTTKIRIIYEVIERIIDKNGQYLLFPSIEVNNYRDNTGLSDEMVINEYHAHGESEQFHSELKTDLGLEKLASGKFASNYVLLCCGMIAYNILRVIGMKMYDCENIPMRSKKNFRRRLRTVIINIIHCPVQFIKTARTYKLDLGCSNMWADVFINIFNYYSFA